MIDANSLVIGKYCTDGYALDVRVRSLHEPLDKIELGKVVFAHFDV